MGLNVPNNISIVGFNNWFMFSVISPSLTTINQPGFKIGKAAFKQLYKELKQRKNMPVVYKKITIETELDKRDFTK
jgi:LacI family transcriptional regulator